MAIQHLIKDKSGNVVAVVQNPQDVEDAAKAANSGKPPPKPKQPPPGEVFFQFMPPLSTIGTLIGWPFYLPPHQPNSSWCIPDGTFLFHLRPEVIGSCCANPIGWPIQDMTINGRIYSATPGSLTEAFNKGTLKLEWQTLSTHYGPSHVRPIATFSNLQTGTFVNYAGSPVSPGVPPNFSTAGQPFVGDAIDFTITHTGMHDVGFPHLTGQPMGPPQYFSQYADPTGNMHFLVSGLYSEFDPPATLPGGLGNSSGLICYAVELHNIAYDGQLWDPFNLPMQYMQTGLVNPDKEIFPIPVPQQGIGMMPAIFAGFNVFGIDVNASVSGACSGIFQSWPYGYQEKWWHDPSISNMIFTNIVTNPYAWPINPPPFTNPAVPLPSWYQMNAPVTQAQLNDLINGYDPNTNTTTSSPYGPWTGPNGITQPSGIRMGNLSAHVQYANQSSYCEWRMDWENAGSPVGQFTSSLIGPTLQQWPGQEAHEYWGYTTAEMESDDFCGCCDNLVHPGVATLPFPPQNGAVVAEWLPEFL